MTISETTPTAALADYMVRARAVDLPGDVTMRGKLHILDTLAAMVSGTTLPVGQMALRYAGLQGTGSDATALGLRGLCNGTVAALANGMLAHADETDDSHAAAGMHPGCAIVPAALAMAEKNGKSGADLLKAVVLGYDVGARLMRAIGASLREKNRRYDSHAVGGVFGAAAAAGACTASPLNVLQSRYLLSYAAQQASGLASYPMDSSHVEKGFIFGGMPARSGMTAAAMLEAGFTGIEDDLEGYNGFLPSYGAEKADARQLSAGLGERFEIMATNIKKYSVGSPIQAPVDCLANIIRRDGVGPDDFAEMIVHTHHGEDRITRSDQHMSSLNLRYLLAVTLLDGGLSFQAAHDDARVHRPEVERISSRISIKANPSLWSAESPRQGIVEFVTRDGRTLTDHVVAVRGAMENPMSTDEVAAKARELFEVALPADRADRAITAILDLESLPDIGRLMRLLNPG
ncbi:MmgE/PrpD family protein [Pseudochelatococcus sp. B33]